MNLCLLNSFYFHIYGIYIYNGKRFFYNNYKNESIHGETKVLNMPI